MSRLSIVALLGAVACSGAAEPAYPATPATPTGSTAESRSSSVEARGTTPSDPVGASLAGAAIDAWFRERGVETPRSLDPEQARCQTVRAAVPSGQALHCEQRSTIDPLAKVTRQILYDVRNGRTLILMNLISAVAPAAAEGSTCGGALVRLDIELSSTGEALTVADQSECTCQGRAEALIDQAKQVRSEGRTRDATALEFQAKEVQSACSQLGAYQWEDHGFVPAR